MPLRPKVIRADQPKPGRVPVAAADEDKYLEALLKWIPIEVVAAYQALMAAIPIKEADERLTITLIMIPICAGWIAFATKEPATGFAWRQTILATMAFVFWSAAVQNEILDARWVEWKQYTGSVVLILGSALVLPIVEGILRRIGVPQNA